MVSNINRIAFVFLILLLFGVSACRKNSEGIGGENRDMLTVTCEALDITAYSASITAYANLPYDLGGAEVGIMYDESQSFVDARKAVTTELNSVKRFTVKITGLSPSTTYYYKSYVQDGTTVKCGAVKSFTTLESRCPAGAVDLGIVMHRDDGTSYELFWAKSNLCESGLCANPEDSGDYYAWGETEPKSNYSWSTYKWCNGTDNTLTKYNSKSEYGMVDGIAELQRGENPGETVDDAARAKLGGKWRMPTDAEWGALFTQCSWKLDALNGTSGHLLTAPNGNSVFFPDTGFWKNDVLHLVGVCSYYWSSSLYSFYTTGAGYALLLKGGVNTGYCDRYYGYPIRPVTE